MTSYRAGLISRPRPVALVENRLAGKAGGGRPKSARSAINKAKVQEMSCSQDDQPDTSKSTRQIAGETGISATSVRRIAKVDLGLSTFRRMSVQVINAATKLMRLTHS